MSGALLGVFASSFSLRLSETLARRLRQWYAVDDDVLIDHFSLLRSSSFLLGSVVQVGDCFPAQGDDICSAKEAAEASGCVRVNAAVMA